MSTTYDTLTYAGNEKSFAAWGFAFDVTDELWNQKEDVFTATILGASLVTETDTPTFPFEAVVVVQTGRVSATGLVNSFSGGAITFAGKRVGNPTLANGMRQGVTYKFLGPWYDLKNTDFQQQFLGANGIEYLLPELVLNTSTAVSAGQIMISAGDQIQAALQWLLDQYAAQGFAAPYQYTGRLLHAGAIDLNSTSGVYNYAVSGATTIDASLFALYLPSYIAKPMKCADVIQKCLELSPRISCSFDYSSTPPTFHAALVDAMTAANLAVFDGISHQSLNITSRPELMVRCVNLIYRITNTISGHKVIDYAQDKWGPHGSNSASDPNTGLRVVNELIDLTGATVTTVTAHVDSEPALATADAGGTSQALLRGWWQAPRGGNAARLADSRVRFQDATGAQTTIPDATITDAATGAVLTTADLIAYGLATAGGALALYRLVRGTAHAWMIRSDGQPVVSKKVHVTAPMVYAEYDAASATGSDTDLAGNVVSRANTKQMHADLEVSNGPTGAYSATSSTTAAEAYIIGAGGIAQYLFNHLNVMQYEGSHVKVEVTFGAGVTLRNKINFTGGAVAWTAMNAQPQSIRRNYGRKTTEVQIGVAKQLNSGQLSALLNMWRFRRPWYNPSMRTNNAQSSGAVDEAIAASNANTPGGLENVSHSTVFNYSTPPTGATAGVVASAVVHDAPLLATHDALN